MVVIKCFHLWFWFPNLVSTKHNITLTGQDDAHSPTVKDLSDALTKATGVPQNSQKIIFKGTLGEK